MIGGNGNMAENKSIYHYCSADTFIAIIQNRSIRLSDLNKTNDFQEKKWASKLIVEVLKEKLIANGINFSLEEDYWYNDFSANHLQYYENEMNTILFDEKPILIACFSKNEDLLSQWRAYGQDGTGICIGLNYKKIKTLHNGKDLLVEKIYYKENMQKRKLGDLIESAINYMRNMFDEDSVRVSNDFNSYFENEFDAFCEVLIDYIGQIGCTIKNPAFSEEKEIRIIYDPDFPDREITGDIELSDAEQYFSKVKDIGDFRLNSIKYCNKRNQLIPYCDLNFGKLINKNFIDKIVIGPKCGFSVKDIYYYLLSNGYDSNSIEIKESMATYR